jgi:hypothetical protein
MVDCGGSCKEWELLGSLETTQTDFLKIYLQFGSDDGCGVVDVGKQGKRLETRMELNGLLETPFSLRWSDVYMVSLVPK